MRDKQKKAAYDRMWRAAHREYLRQYDRDHYRNKIRSNPRRYQAMIAYQRQYARDHKLELGVANRERDQRYRRQVLHHYSDGKLQCACCGESVYPFLTLDHVNGGGRKHKQRVGGNYWRSFITEGFPDGLRVLCMNCNFAIRLGDPCFHESLRLAVSHLTDLENPSLFTEP